MSARIDALWLYPIKGCRGLRVPGATLAQTGLEVDGIGDREWVVVDESGEFLSQRELPKMALIETRLTGESLRLRAPDMLQLDIPFASEGEVLTVKVWNDEVAAVTQGEIADAWLTQFLGLRCRLMRFDPQASRVSNAKYTGRYDGALQVRRCICATRVLDCVAGGSKRSACRERCRSRGDRALSAEHRAGRHRSF